MEYEESDVPLADAPTQRGKTITPEVVFWFLFNSASFGFTCATRQTADKVAVESS